jgi:uncharacterized Zn finger protein (UPF0148 family)
VGSEIKVGDTCPRCGLPVDYVEHRRTKTGQVYYIAWHYVYVNGQRKVKKCYLGPRTYRHGQVTHQNTGIVIHGMVVDLEDIPRYAEYLTGMAERLQHLMEEDKLSSKHARATVEAIEKLAGLIEPMRHYIEAKAREEQEAKEQEGEPQ